jgi:hypothetical protein
MSTAYLVRVLDSKGAYISHRIFSSQELADGYMHTEAEQGRKTELIQREAVPETVAKVRAKGN